MFPIDHWCEVAEKFFTVYSVNGLLQCGLYNPRGGKPFLSENFVYLYTLKFWNRIALKFLKHFINPTTNNGNSLSDDSLNSLDFRNV